MSAAERHWLAWDEASRPLASARSSSGSLSRAGPGCGASSARRLQVFMQTGSLSASSSTRGCDGFEACLRTARASSDWLESSSES